MNNLINIFKSVKGKIVLGVSAVTVAVAIIAAVVIREESYRSIVAAEVAGTVLLTNDKKTEEAIYEGQPLYDGDFVQVQEGSCLTMVLDTDKYVLAEEYTEFELEASGEKGQGKTVIHLSAGSVLNRLENPLGEGESYEVTSPNSTMSVRGTVFRVTVYVGEDDLKYTKLDILNGKVHVALRTETGEYNGVEEDFTIGDSVLMRGNTEFSEFVLGEDGNIVRDIDYEDIPALTAEFAEDEITGHEHTLGDWEVIEEATCTAAGEEGRYCTVCEKLAETREIPPAEHSAGEWKSIEDAACTQKGREAQYCTVCGEEMAVRETEVTGHTAGNWTVVTYAGCTSAGSEHQICSVCGEELAIREIEATGHSAGDWIVQTQPSCLTDGTEVQKCSVCGKTLSTRSLPATGLHSYTCTHDWLGATLNGSVTVNVPCANGCGTNETHTMTANALLNVTCSCGASHTHTGLMSNHAASDAASWTYIITCADCGDIKSESHIVRHVFTWDGYTTSVTAAIQCVTCGNVVLNTPEHIMTVNRNADGGVYFTCTNCGVVELQAVQEP